MFPAPGHWQKSSSTQKAQPCFGKLGSFTQAYAYPCLLQASPSISMASFVPRRGKCLKLPFGFGVIRFEPDGFAVVGRGFLAAAQACERHSKIKMRFGIIGIQLQGSLVMRDTF